MSRILLVHGSAHGSWCWRDVLALLAARGHVVQALDLPGAGDDRTPLAKVTLAGYGAAIRDAIRTNLRGPTMLVGHSAGGFAIAEAAVQGAPATRLVYLCAYRPAPGMSLVDMRRAGPPDGLDDALTIAPDRQAFRFTERALAETLYHECPDGTLAYARPRLGWQPLAPQRSPLSGPLSGPLSDLPQSYITCDADRVIPPAHQRQMAAGLAPGDIHALPTGHSPFFAAPAALAGLIDRIAAQT